MRTIGIEYFSIKDFSVFNDIAIKFASGVNVIIGENGTGKTHLLKLLYAYHNDEMLIEDDIFYNKGFKYSLEQGYEEDRSTLIECANSKYNCVFISAKDMLTHAKGFSAMYNKYSEFPFDKTCHLIIDKAQRWKLENIPELAQNIIPKLEEMMGGKIIIKNDDFYVQKSTGTMVKFDVEAEGIKKIGLLWQLLMNESISRDTVLLWDEPEANINPKFIPELVKVLLELSKNGVQIFVTTHDYMFAKYFEVKKDRSDSLIFHSLYKTEDDGVKCESKPNFKDLKHNTIMETFIQLYKEEVERAMN